MPQAGHRLAQAGKLAGLILQVHREHAHLMLLAPRRGGGPHYCERISRHGGGLPDLPRGVTARAAARRSGPRLDRAPSWPWQALPFRLVLLRLERRAHLRPVTWVIEDQIAFRARRDDDHGA